MDVSYWLRDFGLQQYESLLRVHEVNRLEAIAELCMQDLEDLGIKKLGAKRKFLTLAATVRKSLESRNMWVPPAVKEAESPSEHQDSIPSPASTIPELLPPLLRQNAQPQPPTSHPTNHIAPAPLPPSLPPGSGFEPKSGNKQSPSSLSSFFEAIAAGGGTDTNGTQPPELVSVGSQQPQQLAPSPFSPSSSASSPHSHRTAPIKQQQVIPVTLETVRQEIENYFNDKQLAVTSAVQRHCSASFESSFDFGLGGVAGIPPGMGGATDAYEKRIKSLSEEVQLLRSSEAGQRRKVDQLKEDKRIRDEELQRLRNLHWRYGIAHTSSTTTTDNKDSSSAEATNLELYKCRDEQLAKLEQDNAVLKDIQDMASTLLQEQQEAEQRALRDNFQNVKKRLQSPYEVAVQLGMVESKSLQKQNEWNKWQRMTSHTDNISKDIVTSWMDANYGSSDDDDEQLHTAAADSTVILETMMDSMQDEPGLGTSSSSTTVTISNDNHNAITYNKDGSSSHTITHITLHTPPPAAADAAVHHHHHGTTATTTGTISLPPKVNGAVDVQQQQQQQQGDVFVSGDVIIGRQQGPFSDSSPYKRHISPTTITKTPLYQSTGSVTEGRDLFPTTHIPTLDNIAVSTFDISRTATGKLSNSITTTNNSKRFSRLLTSQPTSSKQQHNNNNDMPSIIDNLSIHSISSSTDHDHDGKRDTKTPNKRMRRMQRVLKPVSYINQVQTSYVQHNRIEYPRLLAAQQLELHNNEVSAKKYDKMLRNYFENQLKMFQKVREDPWIGTSDDMQTQAEIDLKRKLMELIGYQLIDVDEEPSLPPGRYEPILRNPSQASMKNHKPGSKMPAKEVGFPVVSP